jgi:hypothetical protein
LCARDVTGTPSFKPQASRGGAFGVGLQRNVIALYKFAFAAIVMPMTNCSASDSTAAASRSGSCVWEFAHAARFSSASRLLLLCKYCDAARSSQKNSEEFSRQSVFV